MVLAIKQVQILTSQINNLNLNQPVHMEAPVNYVLSPFEGNIHFRDPQRLKLYLWEIKDVDKEANKLGISVSNYKDIIDNLLSLANKYSWGLLLLMVNTGLGVKKIFHKVEKIRVAYMHHQAHG